MEYVIRPFDMEPRIAGTSIELKLVFPALMPLTGVLTAKFGLFDSQYQVGADKTLGNGIAITGQDLTITIPAEDTAGLEGVHKFEFWLNLADGKVAGQGVLILIKSLFA
jgi:hypothetical protein